MLDDELFPPEASPEGEIETAPETVQEAYERGKRDGIAMVWKTIDNPGLRE